MKRDRSAGRRKPGAQARSEAASALAIEALSYLANDPEQMSRFQALTGIDPGAIRAAARDPNFLAGVLDYVCGDERLLIGFAGHAGVAPEEIGRARHALGGSDWERNAP
jgi:hypothetical protein